MFHSWLNLIGELLHFADRDFYADWWNAENIDVFWRNWNLPVHRWAIRHLYLPMVDMGYGRSTASIVVFFISAFFHEYMVSTFLSGIFLNAGIFNKITKDVCIYVSFVRHTIDNLKHKTAIRCLLN